MSRSTGHPSKDELLAFLLASDDPTSSQRTREHLLRGCVWCLRALQGWAETARARERAELGQTLVEVPRVNRQRRLVEMAERTVLVVEAERAAAPRLLRELLLLAPKERLEAIRSRDRFRFFGLAELITAEARRACFEDLAQAVELSKLAREVALCIEPGAYPPGLVVDSVALAWGALGNSYRVLGELAEARRALEAARGVLAGGSQDPSVRAEVLSLEGSLRIDEARFDEAVEVLEEAASIHRSYEDRTAEAKVLMQLGNAAGERGEPDTAATLLMEARERLGEEAPGELGLIAGQALMGWLVAAGRVAEARAVLEELEERTRERELSPSLRQGIAWAAARLAWVEGDLDRAERELHAVRGLYGEQDHAFRYCLVTLDLALLCLEQGRTGEVKELARELWPVFASRELHNNALQALVLFQQAAEAETATLALLQDLARYLRQTRKNPYLPYSPAQEA